MSYWNNINNHILAPSSPADDIPFITTTPIPSRPASIRYPHANDPSPTVPSSVHQRQIRFSPELIIKNPVFQSTSDVMHSPVEEVSIMTAKFVFVRSPLGQSTRRVHSHLSDSLESLYTVLTIMKECESWGIYWSFFWLSHLGSPKARLHLSDSSWRIDSRRSIHSTWRSATSWGIINLFYNYNRSISDCGSSFRWIRSSSLSSSSHRWTSSFSQGKSSFD